ncbi:hypothetical protein VU01_14282 [Candidatus Electrothrix marina]|uniref:Uncharacterized protein n=1 Tax=Candidatus Electrothrix marina TaxID=1859130 RepID=A0A444JA32_9BACT|nr:hypothetical protein VU01_14282 [Candidatus Electrothrix marina]
MCKKDKRAAVSWKIPSFLERKNHSSNEGIRINRDLRREKQKEKRRDNTLRCLNQVALINRVAVFPLTFYHGTVREGDCPFSVEFSAFEFTGVLTAVCIGHDPVFRDICFF